MRSMSKLIDANVILRYILNDNEDMCDKAKEIILNGAFTTPEVIAEVVYVLKGVYHVDRTEIAICITTFLNEIDIQNKNVIKRALSIYSLKNLDFVDCILIARHQILKDDIFSFDKKLNNNLEI